MGLKKGLRQGFTNKSIAHNIDYEKDEGKSVKEAQAIALRTARKAAQKSKTKDAKKKLKGLQPKSKKAKEEVKRSDERFGGTDAEKGA